MILIIGYGNVQRGDEGIGWHAANILREEFTSDEEVCIESCAELTPQLCEMLSRVSLAIFLDASASTSCDLSCAPVEPLDMLATPDLQRLSPARLLALSRRLFGRCPRAFEVFIGRANFDGGAECSASARRMLPEMVSLTRCLVAKEKGAQTNYPLPA